MRTRKLQGLTHERLNLRIETIRRASQSSGKV